MNAIYRVQRGFSLISAIFLLVVIAALGAFAVTLSTTQQQSAALDLLGARAYHAARASVDWGAYQIIIGGPAGGFAAACQAGGAVPQPGALPGTLAGFAVAVGCVATSHDEGARTIAGGNPVWIYTLTATATQGVVATSNYVERQISVIIAQ
ncbi:MAG: hypothetical protein A2061_08000 [Gallionellales bacterium GWA2_59_43]|nr:MAG: hypothetical protein A2061_08000 [Gallionellales bacterium GWA2_59_43]